MSLICQVLIGYFDATSACVQQAITPMKPLDEGQVASLQTACNEAFGIKLCLLEHLNSDGLLCITDGVVRPDTYKAAAVAHQLFGMSAVDHAHRCVIFPTEDKALPLREQLVAFYQSLHFDMDEQQSQQKAEEDLRWMRERRDFERRVDERVRSFVFEREGRAEHVAPADRPRE